MRSYENELSSILDKSVELCRAHDAGEALLKGAAAIRTDLKRSVPEMMFYGCYNAGKSSLLNALFSDDGSPLADVSDRPCTAKVTGYDVAGYRVYDTPGLDAPVEHEAVSRAHLERCDVVLFVVSTAGNFDEEDTVREFVRVLEARKAAILVMNDKAKLGLASESLASVQARFLDHVRRVTGQANVQERFDTVLVDAEKATAARLAKRPQRLDDSGVPALGNLVLRRLAQTRGSKLLLPPATALEKHLRDVVTELEGRASGASVDLLRDIEKQLVGVRRRFQDDVDVDVRGLRGKLEADIQGAAGDERGLQSALGNYLQDVNSAAQRRYERAMDEVASVIDAAAKAAPKDVKLAASNARGGLPAVPEVVKDGDNWVMKVDGAQLRQLIQSKEGVEAIKKGLLQLRQWKVPGLKGRWEKTLGRWAGKAAKGIGVFIEVATAVYQWRQASKEQARREQEAMDQRRQTQLASTRVAADLEQDVLRDVPNMAREMFRMFEDQARGGAESEAARLKDVATAARTVAELLEQVGRVVAEIKG